MHYAQLGTYNGLPMMMLITRLTGRYSLKEILSAQKLYNLPYIWHAHEIPVSYEPVGYLDHCYNEAISDLSTYLPVLYNIVSVNKRFYGYIAPKPPINHR